MNVGQPSRQIFSIKEFNPLSKECSISAKIERLCDKSLLFFYGKNREEKNTHFWYFYLLLLLHIILKYFIWVIKIIL